MKNCFCLLITAFLLLSCSRAPTEKLIQTAIAETLIAIPATGSPPAPLTSTVKPVPSATVTHSPTKPPTVTTTPSISYTPTEDLSIYSLYPCLPQSAPYEKGMVTEVIDGDNIDVLLENGQTYRVRYIGVDAPELERPYYAESTKANSNLVLQKEVFLVQDVSDKDQFGRLLRYVVADNVLVNLELVRNGYAAAEPYPPDVACADILSSTEADARGSQVGMWVATQTPEASAPQVIIIAVNKREEWVDIQNVGNSEVDLSGWNLVSERGNQECTLAGILTPNEVLRIWSMAAQGTGYSCGYNSPIWNNSEPDPAVLFNPQGAEVSRK